MTKRPSVYARYSRGSATAKEAATRAGTSERTAQRWTSRSRTEWLQQRLMSAKRSALIMMMKVIPGLKQQNTSG